MFFVSFASGRHGRVGRIDDGNTAWKTGSFSWPGFGVTPPPDVSACVNVWVYRPMSAIVVLLAATSSSFRKIEPGCTLLTIGVESPLVSNFDSMDWDTAPVEISKPPESSGFGIAAWSAVITIAQLFLPTCLSRNGTKRLRASSWYFTASVISGLSIDHTCPT